MVSTEQWRAAIGRWVRGYLPRGGGARGTAQGLGLLASVLGAAVMAVLLAIGGVELNPGPPTNAEIIDILNRNHKEMIDRLDILQARVTAAEATVQSLQTANERLVRKVDYLENQSRRNNIIVTGIPEQRNESWADSEKCILGLAEQLGVRLEPHDIERAHRTGRRREGQPRMIVAKLASFRKREELLRAAREHLSQSSMVRVREDLSWAVRQTRKALIPHLQEAKASGRKASIRFDKLVVAGRSFVLGELAARPRAWEGAGRRGPVNAVRGQNPRRAETPSEQSGACSRPPPRTPVAGTAVAPAAAPRSGAAGTTSEPAASRRRQSRSRSRRRSRSRSRRSSRHSSSAGRVAAESAERGPRTRAMAANMQQQEARVAVTASCSVRMPEQSNDYRVVVFGAGGVGKSSLVLRFVKGTFRESYIPTIEDTYRQVISCNKNICTLQITDTTGSHQFPAMQRLSISKGHAFILVYSVTSKQSLEELKPIWEVIREMKGADLATIPVMLVGNKCDEVENREVAASEGEAEANRWGCNFMETSAKTNHNVKELFQELLNMEKNRNISLDLGGKKSGRQKIPGPNKLKEKCSVM